jgi:hypothetical protein
LTTACERSRQPRPVFKPAQTTERQRRLARFGRGAAHQIGRGAQAFRARICRGYLRREGSAGGIKWPAQGFFQAVFAGSVRVRPGGCRLTQTMKLAGLLRHAGEGLGHGADQSGLLRAEETAHALAQVFDRLEPPQLPGLVLGCEHRHCVESQANLHFAHDVERGVAFLRFESVDRHQETRSVARGRACLKPKMRGAAEYDEQDADPVQPLASGDREGTRLGEPLRNLPYRPALPKSPVATLPDDCQGQAATAHGQAPGRLRSRDPTVSSALRIGAMVAQTDDQVAATQNADIFAPEWITALQPLPPVLTGSLFWPRVTFANLAVVFSSSHQHTSLAQDLSKKRFYPRQRHVGGILPLLIPFSILTWMSIAGSPTLKGKVGKFLPSVRRLPRPCGCSRA